MAAEVVEIDRAAVPVKNTATWDVIEGIDYQAKHGEPGKGNDNVNYAS